MDFNIGRSSGPRKTAKAAPRTGGALAGWLMTAVAPFGENEEHAMDQALVELGLGDARLIRGEGAMLPIGFEPGVPQDLPMGTLVECHLSKATVHNSGTASAGVDSDATAAAAATFFGLGQNCLFGCSARVFPQTKHFPSSPGACFGAAFGATLGAALGAAPPEPPDPPDGAPPELLFGL